MDQGLQGGLHMPIPPAITTYEMQVNSIPC